MFKVYKNRNFNDLINDTFIFFRQEGKNYFGNYFKITGGLIVIFTILVYLISDIFFENFFNQFNSVQQQQMLEKYFDDNLVYFITIGIITCLITLFISAINYLFPVVYFKHLADGIEPTTKSIFKGIKSRIGKIIIFLLGSCLLFIVPVIILFIICGLLIMILVGIPVTVIVFAAIVGYISQFFYEYISNNTGFFPALAKGFKMFFSKFWSNVGTTAIFLIIAYIIQTAITFIFYIISGFITMVNVDATGDKAGALSTLGILILVSFIIANIIGFIMQNVIMINQGIIYYSNKEQQENNSLRDDIDLIGQDIE